MSRKCTRSYSSRPIFQTWCLQALVRCSLQAASTAASAAAAATANEKKEKRKDFTLTLTTFHESWDTETEWIWTGRLSKPFARADRVAWQLEEKWRQLKAFPLYEIGPALKPLRERFQQIGVKDAFSSSSYVSALKDMAESQSTARFGEQKRQNFESCLHSSFTLGSECQSISNSQRALIHLILWW